MPYVLDKYCLKCYIFKCKKIKENAVTMRVTKSEGFRELPFGARQCE